MPVMTNTQAQDAAKAWQGQAGGRMAPQLTENELAGLVNEAVASATKRLLDALDCMDHGCRDPGFKGYENGLGDESAGNELQAAREELTAMVEHQSVPEPVFED